MRPLLLVAWSSAIAGMICSEIQRLGAQQPADSAVHRMDTLRVDASRLRAGGIPLGRLPFGAQVVSVGDLPGAGATLATLLDGQVGISTASQFGSPVQPDLRIRGFQVGPVVGFPQSVSVFVDGVRVNEPDASQVNFDLIPMQAADRVEVIRSPGGAFGRNTLAGAINVVTRRGTGAGPAAALEASGGSYGNAEAQGWVGSDLGGGFDYLLSGRWLHSEGWRDLSTSHVRQLFAKAGYRSGATDLWLSYTFADNRLEGPGSLPQSWLEGDLPPELVGTRDPRRLQFTGFEGDWFAPRLHFATLGATHRLAPRTSLQLTAFTRSNRFTQINDNITEPNARGETDILSVGSAVQLSGELTGGARWAGGVEYVRNRSDILIFEDPNPAFPDAGGMTESVASAEDNAGVFGSLWWPLSSSASLTGSLRYDYVFLPVTDRLDPENSGENRFQQLTGSLGGEMAISASTRLFASYGRGFRAPVILEVSCADPEDPCPLPFELGADPPLDPVTTDTWQAGVRFWGPAALQLELVAYWAEVHDDLFAVIAAPSTRGYFKNLDRTRRQGVELSARSEPLAGLELRGTVALTRATFQSEASLASALVGDDDEGGESGSGEDEPSGAVEVGPGDHFAMVPGITWTAAGEYSAHGWRAELEGAYVGSQYFIGDEWNRRELGNLGGYFVLSGRLERALGSAAVLSLTGENLLDDEHSTFGIIAPNLRGPERDPQPFLTPGLPFRVTAGLRVRI